MSSRQARHTLSRIIPLLLFGTLPLFLCAQGSTSREAKVLANWMNNYASIPAAIGQDELPKFVPGWFDEVEIRSETDEFMLDRQRYVLRGEPKLPHVRNAERRLQNAKRSGLGDLSYDALAESRADALELLFEKHIWLQEAELIDTLYNLQARLVDVTRLRVIEPDYDIEKVLDAEDELANIGLQKKRLEKLKMISTPQIDAEALVKVEDIRLHLLDLKEIEPAVATEQASTLEKLDAEMALERAENLSFLKFLQVEYRSSPDPTDLNRELFSVGGSLAFPQRERNIRKLDELKVERLEKLYEFDLKKQEETREFTDELLKLQLLFESYDAFLQQVETRSARRKVLSETYLKSTESRPEALLRLNRRTIRDQLTRLQMEADIIEGYAVLLGDFIVLDAAGVQRWVLH